MTMNDTANSLPESDRVAADSSESPQTPAEGAAEQMPKTEADLLRERDEEISKLKDAYLRAMAETENVRNRARRENEDTAKFAVTKFARDMVGMAETLARASASVTPDARAGNEMLKQVGEGLDMAMQELLGIFERNGIKRINPEGEKFDHNLHQAVAQVESADKAPGTVLQVLQAGYSLHDRLLRPAMVTVSTQTTAKPADTTA